MPPFIDRSKSFFYDESMLKQAPFIHKGSSIIMIAPSFGATTEPYLTRYQRSVENLSSLGFVIHEGENVHLDCGVASSNTPEKRAEEFMKAYASDNEVLLSVGGGELMDEMLPFVDFKKIRKLPPKWFIGYSDNTNLTFPLTTLCDVITVYGPCGTTYYEKPIRLSEKNTLLMLEGKKEFLGYPRFSSEVNDPSNPLHRLSLRKVKKITPIHYQKPFEGILLGGCLDCLVTLCGTEFDGVKAFLRRHPNKKIVWFLEACDLNPLSIRRALFQLKEAGWFDHTSGFLFGRPLCQDQKMFSVNKVTATDILSDLHVPMLLDVDLGHIPPVLPMKCGAEVKVTYQDHNIKMEYQE